MVKISVIVPVYNTEKYLKECLDSILNQTLKDIEIICVNDGSTDNSLKILNEYYDLDNRISVVSQKNSGLSVSRNNGINLSKGEYIYFIDSDDYLEPTALEELYSISKKSNLDILIFKLINFKDGSTEKYTDNYYEMSFLNPWANKVFTFKDLGEKSLDLAVSAPGKLFKRDLIKDIKFPEGLIFEDNVFFAEAMLKSKRVSFYNKHLYNRRRRDDSITTTFDIKFADSITIVNKIIDLAKEFNAYNEFKYALAKKKINHANMRYSLVDDEFKEDFFKKAKEDFKNYEKEYILYIFDKLTDWQRAVFENILTSNNHEEYDLKMENYSAKNKKIKVANEIKMDESFEDNINNIIKNKEIFFIFDDFNLEFGGLMGAVFRRANYLSNQGYKINLLSLDPIKNFDYILSRFQEMNVLSPQITFINVYDYYANKNTITDDFKHTLETNLDNDEYIIEKVTNNDSSITLNYFTKDAKNDLLKSELYIDDILIYKEDNVSKTYEYFTKDGFKYLVRNRTKDTYELYDCEGKKKKFKGINEFMYNFMNDVCSKFDKPFLVCDSTSHYYNMNGVKTEVFKIGVMHGNPYVFDNEPIDYISPRINHLSHLDDLETVVVLTNEVKNDLINELKQDKFTVIPNFMPNEMLETELLSKDTNKIRIFSRISPEKQISDAIKAFEIVSEKRPDAVLEIFGRAITGNEKAEFERLLPLVKESGLEDNVIFKGHLDDVNPEMQRSLCTLLISKHEGLPLSLLESMANATPVIAYDLKYGPHDVITDGEDGIIIEKGNIEELADRIIYLLDNPDTAIEMGLNAREKIKSNFSTSSVGYKWEELFKNIFINSLFNDVNQMEKNIKKLKKRNKKLKSKNKKLKKINNTILNSKSWKITKPFRKIMNFLKKNRNK